MTRVGSQRHSKKKKVVSYIVKHLFIYFLGAAAPQWVMASSFRRFLGYTRRTTVGRTPLWKSDQLVAETFT